jgi:hypothetical protein
MGWIDHSPGVAPAPQAAINARERGDWIPRQMNHELVPTLS